jgi:hypothetical protein
MLDERLRRRCFMVIEFKNKEREYEEFLSGGPAFVCNNLGYGPETHRIHSSECSMLNRAGPAKTGLHTSVRKACSRDLDELVEWVVAAEIFGSLRLRSGQASE